MNVHTITAHMATMSAVGHLTDVTTTLNITVIVPCLQLLARAVVPSEGVLKQQAHILSLEYEIHLPLPVQQDVTSTEMIEGDVLIELITTVEADHLIPPSQGTHLLNGLQGKPQKLPILLKERLCPLEEAQDRDLTADHRARTLSAAPAVQAVAGMYLKFYILAIYI